MTQRRILFFNGDQLSALRWHNGHIGEEGSFNPDLDGQGRLAAYLTLHHKSLFYLLADVSEEGFQLDTIPPVGGKDRTALLQRRLGQYFYGTPLRLAQSHGRGKDGRKDERVLFAGLTRPEEINPWLDVVRTSGVAFVGIYSVPLILEGAALPVASDLDHYLLVTVGSGGLRQTYFANGHVQFSRQAPLAGTDNVTLARACALETAKTAQYLRGQRQLDRNTLRVVVLTHIGQMTALRDACVSNADIQFDFANLGAAAEAAGCKTVLPSSRCDFLMAHLLMRRLPREQFAAAETRLVYRLWRWRLGLRLAAAVLISTTVIFAARFYLDTSALEAETATLNQQTETDTQRYEHLLATLPKIPLSADNLRAMLASYGELQARDADILPLLVHLGTTLDEMPGIELVDLKWDALPQVPASLRSAIVKTVADGTANTANTAWTTLELRATLPGALSGDQRAQLAVIDAMALRLRLGGHQVEILRTPVNIESAKMLRSVDGDVEADVTARAFPKLSFDLRISRAMAGGSS